MKYDVAILIVTYNSGRHIIDCLTSVFGERQVVKQQVIVLDNASTDDTVARVRERFPEVSLIVSERNLGFAAGVNAAAAAAHADYLLLLNPDTVILDHAIDKLLRFAHAHPQNGLYGGNTRKADGTLEPSSCWGLPTLWSLLMFATGLSTLAKRNRLFDPESLGSWPRDSVREVDVITGCFLLVKTKIWQTLAGFDERFFMYGEDVDLAMRARKAGYRPILCPTARLIHEVGQSSSTPLHKALLLYRGKATFVRTHWTGFRRATGVFLLAAGVGIRALPDLLRIRRSTVPSTWAGLWRQRNAWLPGYAPTASASFSPNTRFPATTPAWEMTSGAER